MTDTISEAQDFQSIGQASPDVERVAQERNGWQGDLVQYPADEITSHDFSKWEQRANRQAYASPQPIHLDSIAGYTPPRSMAEQPVEPFTYQELPD